MSLNIVADLIAGIFKPAAELVDELHTSKEEQLNAKSRLLEVEAAVLTKAYEYERKTLEAKARIVAAEAKSERWLTAMWRPITMMVFLGLAVLDAFGLVEQFSGAPLVKEAYYMLTIGIGGYVGGRSLEKINKDRVVKKALE